MSSKFRVRFAGPKIQNCSFKESKPHKQQPRVLDVPEKRTKSRHACLDCKLRHVKCGEEWPVCRRCQQRGSICRSAFRSSQWQIEVPGLTFEKFNPSVWSHTNSRLLQYWIEKGSAVMVIDPNNNPFSFGILRYLETTESLVYTIQSLSVAHETFFTPSALPEQSYQDRGTALLLIQRELQQSNPPARGSLLTAILLGLGSAWVFHEANDDFGHKHLQGARAMLDILLAQPGSENDPFVQQAVAVYLGWDQATAFLLHPLDQIPLHSPELCRCVQTMRSEYNATIGYAVELMYMLGDVGRYCRTVVETGLRNIELEVILEEQLLTYEPTGEDRNSHLVNHAFRKHGLIMLYRTIASAPTTLLPDFGIDASHLDDQNLSQYARDILENVAEIPADNCYHSILSQPLFTAGSELTANDAAQREKVRESLQKQFSLTRLPDNLRAIELLDEMWNLRDNGSQVSWLAFLVQRAGKFMLC